MSKKESDDVQISTKEFLVLVKSPIWGDEEKVAWSNFRTWIESKGGVWVEGFGCNKIKFTI